MGADEVVCRPITSTPSFLLDVSEWTEEMDIPDAQQKQWLRAHRRLEMFIRWNSGAGKGGRVVSFVLLAAAAVKISEVGRLNVGWSHCRVKLLGKRQPNYFWCEERGHLAADFRNEAKEKRVTAPERRDTWL